MEHLSVQLVGREFVRQYYTLLNRTPEFLHRLYRRDSSYTHGGLGSSEKLTEAVCGPEEIHRKITSLHFKDCCAKISLVDAHATLNHGVLVQVLGELSNAGQPMRSFMQTFVLAREGSATNRFYVHNDIFHYKDEVFEDSELDEEESDDEVEVEAEEGQTLPEPLQESPTSTTDGEPHHVTNLVEEPVEESVPEPELVPESEPREEEPVQEPEPLPEPEPREEEPVPEPEPREEEKTLEAVEENAASPAPVASPPKIQEPPKTVQWASVVKRNLPPPGTALPSGRPRPAPQASTKQTRAKAQAVRPNAPARAADAAKSASNVANTRGRGDVQPKVDKRRVPRHPDSHQVFVGFLPRDATDEELKQFFSTYGRVVDLSIRSKPDVRVANFGFVTFDGPAAVQTILQSKPILFRNTVRLNVEEKKTKVAPAGGSHSPDDRRDTGGNGQGENSRSLVPNGMRRNQDGRDAGPRHRLTERQRRQR